jgi:xanthine dehydrogenase accessory factor
MLAEIGIDGWTAYVGATHEDHHDLGGCLAALRANAAWVGMVGARSRAQGRLAALRTAGASEEQLARLHLTPGMPALGKAPFEVATGVLAEIMQAFARIGAEE